MKATAPHRPVARPGAVLAERRRSPVRPLVATAEIVVLGGVAHAGAGGTLPETGELLALTGLVGLVAAALHHRLLHVGVAAAVATTGQLLVHQLGSPAVPHDAHLAVGTAPPSSARDMLLAHLVTAAVTCAALVWQEQLLLAVATGWRLRHPAAPPPYGAPRLRPDDRPSGPTAVPLLGAAPRRGPPAVPASAAS